LHPSIVGSIPWKQLSDLPDVSSKTPWAEVSRFQNVQIPWPDLNPSNVPWEDLDPTNVPWEDLDPSQIPWEDLDPTKIPWEDLDPSQIPWEDLDPTKIPWEDLDPSQIPWEDLDPSQIPWEKLDPSQIPWEKLDASRIPWGRLIPVNIPWDLLSVEVPWSTLDPAQIPWERVDPSKVNWSAVDPSTELRQADRWLQANGVDVSKLDPAGLPLTPQQISDRLAEADKVFRNRAADFEEAIRTEAGNLTEQVKDAPWYKAFADWLSSLLTIIVLDSTSTADLDFNFDTGAYAARVDLIPGLDLDEGNIDRFEKPTIQPIELAAASFENSFLRLDVHHNYDGVKSEILQSTPPGDVYVVSKRFIEWFSLENAIDQVISSVFLGQSDKASQRTLKILRLEMDDMAAWLKARGNRELENVLTPETIETLVTGGTVTLPEVTIEPVEFQYRYEAAPAGVTKVAADLLRPIAESLDLLPPGTDPLPSSVGWSVPSFGFKVTWKGAPPSSDFLVQRINSFDARAFALRSTSAKRNELLTGALGRLRVKGKVFELAFSAIQGGDPFSSLAAETPLFRELQIDADTLRRAFDAKNPEPILDLRGTPVANRLLDQLQSVAIGNEGQASLDRLDFDLSTYSLHVGVRLRHRHVWNFEGILSSIGSLVNIDLAGTGVSRTPEIDRGIDQQKASISTEQAQIASAPLTSQQGKIQWHLLEPELPQLPTIGALNGSRPVYFVPGALTTAADADGIGRKLADQLHRPIVVVANPTWIEGDTGTPNHGTDLAEFYYDIAWPQMATRFLGQLSAEQFSDVVNSAGAAGANRLQANPTSRLVATILHSSSGPVDIVTHSQGSAIVRNACVAMELLGESHVVSDRLRWIACGSPVLEHELPVRPASFVSLWHPSDLSRDYLLGRSDPDSVFHAAFDPTTPDKVAYAALLPQGDKGMGSYIASVSNGLFQCSSNQSCTPCTRIYAGDMDGDGFDDIWSSCEFCSSQCGAVVSELSISANQNSFDDFGADYVLTRPFGDVSGRLFVGDINGDAFDDILLFKPTVRLSHGVRTTGFWLARLNDRHGGFESLYFLRRPLREGDIGWDLDCSDAIFVADMNGDGICDFLELDKCTGEARTEFNRLKEGAYDGAQAAHWESIAATTGGSIRDVAVADIDGDRCHDLVVSRRCCAHTGIGIVGDPWFNCGGSDSCCHEHWSIHMNLHGSNPLHFGTDEFLKVYSGCRLDAIGDWDGDDVDDTAALVGQCCVSGKRKMDVRLCKMFPCNGEGRWLRRCQIVVVEGACKCACCESTATHQGACMSWQGR